MEEAVSRVWSVEEARCIPDLSAQLCDGGSVGTRHWSMDWSTNFTSDEKVLLRVP